jgi:LysR family nitrogen assimilation transcriptional regulator
MSVGHEVMSSSSKLHVDVARLRLFAQVAEAGSLTKAAVMLDSVQSDISRRISALEHEFGGRLFHRTGRGVALTELGEQILPRVRELLEAADRLSSEVKGTAIAPRGEVRIGTMPSLSHPLINLLFRRTAEHFPQVRLHVFEGSSGQLDEWLKYGRLDLAILFRYGKASLRNEDVLALADSYLVGPIEDALTQAPTIDFAKLDGLPLILPGVPNGLRVALDGLAKRKRISLRVVMEADSLPIQKDIVADRGGYTVLAGHAVLQDVEAGRLQAARIVNPGIERIIALGTTTHHPLTLASREVGKLVHVIAEEVVQAGMLKAPG